MEIIELMKERHSVRQYTDKKIEKEKREVLNAVSYTHLTLPTIA